MALVPEKTSQQTKAMSLPNRLISRRPKSLEIGAGAALATVLSAYLQSSDSSSTSTGGLGDQATFAGVPITLLTTLALWVGAAFAGDYESDLAALGDGAFAAYVAGVGQQSIATGSFDWKGLGEAPSKRGYKKLLDVSR